jgi:hypothetical protein
VTFWEWLHGVGERRAARAEQRATRLTAAGTHERGVLLVVALGLITILLAIILGLFTTPRVLPNWAENVLVSIATAAGLKLGDVLSTLVALSSGRSTERLGTLLGNAPPAGPIKAEVTNGEDKPIPVEPQL